MEAAMSSNNQKRRSLIKSKLLSKSFSKVVTKPFTGAVAGGGNHHGGGGGGGGGSKVKALAPPVWMDKRSNYAFTPPPVTKQIGNPSSSSHHVYYGDDNVDSKAACYISNVRERFKLERFDWDQTAKHHNITV